MIMPCNQFHLSPHGIPATSTWEMLLIEHKNLVLLLVPEIIKTIKTQKLVTLRQGQI